MIPRCSDNDCSRISQTVPESPNFQYFFPFVNPWVRPYVLWSLLQKILPQYLETGTAQTKLEHMGCFSSEPLTFLLEFFLVLCVGCIHVHAHAHTHTDTQWCPGRKRCHSNNTTCAASAQPGLRVALKPAGGRVRSWGASFWAPHLTVCTWWTGRLTSWNFRSLYVESVCNI